MVQEGRCQADDITDFVIVSLNCLSNHAPDRLLQVGMNGMLGFKIGKGVPGIADFVSVGKAEREEGIMCVLISQSNVVVDQGQQFQIDGLNLLVNRQSSNGILSFVFSFYILEYPLTVFAHKPTSGNEDEKPGCPFSQLVDPGQVVLHVVRKTHQRQFDVGYSRISREFLLNEDKSVHAAAQLAPVPPLLFARLGPVVPVEV